MSEETKFNVMVSMFEWIQKSKQSAKKRSKLRKFFDMFCSPSDYFTPLRLMLPSLDRERGSYGLKESFLATCLIDAIGMSRESADAVRLINWRKGGAKTGPNAGNFALVAAEVLQLRQVSASGGLTIKELNAALDQLSLKENRGEKASIISGLIKRTNAQEMKWIIMIILKDLKLGMSEKTIFNEFHPDADDLFNVTCDLKLVCEKLKDRTLRHKRQDIEVGKAVRPQLANRVGDSRAAWKKLHGKEVVVECKFDGDRIQVHKNGSELHFFSRNFFDHMEYALPMSDILVQNLLTERCILDGEMLVWDKTLNRFAEFGSNREIVTTAKGGLDSDRQLCYVAFDILYVGDGSVIHQSLKERHELLNKYIRPVSGRLEILIPDGSLNSHPNTDARCWSKYAYSVDDIEDFYKETIENRDEGIVIKDLGSNWEPGDRSGKWMKLKPDYVRAGSDLDVLIIGGYYGSGRRGGEVAQFLMGLAERHASDTHPRKFVSFCKVGTGLSDDELDSIVTKLKPYFRKYEYPKKPPPVFYKVTDHSKERPDVWIENPEKSIILSITSDIRTIRSEVFESPYSLRFPRIDKVRYDKPWFECLDVKTFIDLVHSSNGTTQRKGTEGEDDKYMKPKSSRKPKKNKSTVPLHLSQTDVSNIKKQTNIFSGMMLYFVNVPPTHSLESLHKMVTENGGTFSMNLNGSVTHSIAAQNKGLKFEAAKLRGDVIHCSWVLDCCSQMKLLQLRPNYFLFISTTTKKNLEEDMDEFMDSYYWDLDLVELKKLLNDVKVTSKFKDSNDQKIKYCPDPKWSLFHGCNVYFLSPLTSEATNGDILSFTMRRLKNEVMMGGGTVCPNLSQATHIMVFPVNESHLFDNFNPSEKRLISKKKVHLVKSQWLEDSLKWRRRLAEDIYNLRSKGSEVATSSKNVSGNKTKDPKKRRRRLVKQSGESLGNEQEDSWCDDTEELVVKKENERDIGCGSEPAKVEIMVDPVHAMLIDMIPSVAANKNDDRQQNECEDQQPSKKKKVSYKDLAFQLLND